MFPLTFYKLQSKKGSSTINVSKGQKVSKGQQIAGVGCTGYSTGNHLHFGVLLKGTYVDPLPYIT